MKNYNKFLIFLISLLVLLSPIQSLAEKETVVIDYFGVDLCISCVKAVNHLDQLVEDLEDQGFSIIVNKYNITDIKDEKQLISLNNALNISGDQYKLIPAIFIGEDYLIDLEDIEEGLEPLILKASKLGQREVNLENDSFKSQTLTVGAIVLAGLLDGINPCSIAMMLFFVSMVMMGADSKGRNSILKIGLCFSLGVFLSYFGIGVGIFNFIYAFSGMKNIMIIIYALLFFMGAFLMTLNLKDYYHIKKGEEGKIKNQLSRERKKKIHDFIRKMSNNNDYGLYLVAFIVAFVISFMEFFCTGQIYLPTITYMIKNTNDNGYLLLLALYNMAFILPLLLIAIALNIGKEIIDVSSILLNKLHILKMIGAIFFLIVMLYSMQQISILI